VPPSPPQQSTINPTPARSANDGSALDPAPPPSPMPTVADGSRPAATPAPPPTGPVQNGVVLGDVCSPLGALGKTANGSSAMCLPGDGNKLRWKSVG
jgi:hypothetical protein